MDLRSFGTHDGSFHADELSACALLLVFDLIDRDKIRRTRDPETLEKCEYVCDVGGVYDPETKRFDHHQLDYSGSLASAGMIWKYLRDRGVVDPDLYSYVNDMIIIGIDAHDNGKVMHEPGVATFSHVIAGFAPISHSAGRKEQDEAFFQALDFATGHFDRMIRRYHYIRACKEKVASAMEPKGKALIFDEPMPWQDNFFDLGGEQHPALFVVMPSGNHWKLRGIPPNSHDRMGVRMPLPESWAGLRDEQLKKVSGVEGAIFCHKGRFISVWETKEDALKALSEVLGREG